MNKITFLRPKDEFSSLALIGRLGQNNRTTKQIAVKPSRHPLAIFTPTVSDNSATGVNISSLQDTDSITSYGGLIGVNTRPKGNSPSRLFAVVETCHPIFGWRKLTKQIGNPMNFIHSLTSFLTGILSKLSHFTTAESLTIGFVLGLPIACLVVGILAIMGV